MDLLTETLALLEQAEQTGQLAALEPEFYHELNAFANGDEGLVDVARVAELNQALRALRVD